MKNTFWILLLILLPGSRTMHASGSPGLVEPADTVAFCFAQKGFKLLEN